MARPIVSRGELIVVGRAVLDKIIHVDGPHIRTALFRLGARGLRIRIFYIGMLSGVVWSVLFFFAKSRAARRVGHAMA